MIRNLNTATTLAAVASILSMVISGCASGSSQPANTAPPPAVITPTTPQAAIKHIVVIFGENESFDHYFGTYPNAENLNGETKFAAATGTAVPNNYVANPGLLTNNPNSLNARNNVTSGSGVVTSVASNPYRLAPAQAWTASQSHDYTAEQTAFNQLNMDLFPVSVGAADNANELLSAGTFKALNATKALTMAYFDGNTVTGLWNYAQHYAMSDNSFSSTFGPSTQGALNLISGQTDGVLNPLNLGSSAVPDGNGGQTLISDADPAGDICSSTSKNTSMSGQNIGDLLNTAKLSWGWFEGGFDLSVTNANNSTGCSRSSVIVASGSVKQTATDYVPHHQPFQYYLSTRNPTHARPTTVASIGTTDAANHQYDTHDFTDALAAGNLPAVSFLKAPSFQDAHPGNSDPLDEQTFIVNTVNTIQKSQFWSSTVVIIAYDDSDGWYDHVSSLINGSATSADVLSGTGVCISSAAAQSALKGWDGKPAAQGRCGYGMRQPLIVISPWVKKNYIDHTLTDQASVLRLIEDVFLGSQRIAGGGSFDTIAGSLMAMFDFSNGAAPPNAAVVTLDPTSGAVTSGN